MENFCRSIPDQDIRETLATTIQKEDPLNQFKEKIYQHNIHEHWYTFRDNAVKDVALKWCQENEIEYI